MITASFLCPGGRQFHFMYDTFVYGKFRMVSYTPGFKFNKNIPKIYTCWLQTQSQILSMGFQRMSGAHNEESNTCCMIYYNGIKSCFVPPLKIL